MSRLEPSIKRSFRILKTRTDTRSSSILECCLALILRPIFTGVLNNQRTIRAVRTIISLIKPAWLLWLGGLLMLLPWLAVLALTALGRLNNVSDPMPLVSALTVAGGVLTVLVGGGLVLVGLVLGLIGLTWMLRLEPRVERVSGSRWRSGWCCWGRGCGLCLWSDLET